jgi:hypothetical protein
MIPKSFNKLPEKCVEIKRYYFFSPNKFQKVSTSCQKNALKLKDTDFN